ncbi:hypothetical protein SVA_0106 [Sulfurifustis variabilis]|uniref:Uncharacterized protein n=1 Tax=Sulfurifustis variabilis TaxID=1675686 RepID=A0A1B4UZV4_9GAMM|nr:hypothetical protein SVA_0106 [Sulfurifustis variabilis]
MQQELSEQQTTPEKKSEDEGDHEENGQDESECLTFTSPHQAGATAGTLVIRHTLSIGRAPEQRNSPATFWAFS